MKQRALLHVINCVAIYRKAEIDGLPLVVFQTVRQEASEKSEREAKSAKELEERTKKLIEEYGQTPAEASLYTLYQNIHNIAMTDS